MTYVRADSFNPLLHIVACCDAATEACLCRAIFIASFHARNPEGIVGPGRRLYLEFGLFAKVCGCFRNGALALGLRSVLIDKCHNDYMNKAARSFAFVEGVGC